MATTALSDKERALIDAYWRAANYLSVGQIYLYDNPLLKEPLTKDHIKPRLLGLLPEEFPGDSGRANFRYYEPRCGHGSSLSGAMHAMVAARLGDSELALRYFQQAVAIDLADNHTTIAGGLHMAALGGTWLTAIFGFAGLSLQNDGVAFNPRLPASWRTMKFAIHWRGRRLRIGVDSTEQLFHATLEAGDAMAVYVNGRREDVRSEREMVCPFK